MRSDYIFRLSPYSACSLWGFSDKSESFLLIFSTEQIFTSIIRIIEVLSDTEIFQQIAKFFLTFFLHALEEV